MSDPRSQARRTPDSPRSFCLLLPLVLVACTSSDSDGGEEGDGGGGGDTSYVEDGMRFFREATFGTEGFWTEAAQLPQGLEESDFTLIDALATGLQVDSESLDSDDLATIVVELATDLSPSNAPLLNDPIFFQKALSQNAIVGMIADDANGDLVIDGDANDTLGLSCVLCHGGVDGSIYDGSPSSAPLAGSIGVRVDGPGNQLLDHGALLAVARNSRAMYPHLPLSLGAIGGEPIARTGAFAEVTSTEAEVDALLLDIGAFPIGQVDMLPDGIGAPVNIPPVYQVRPVAPFGVAGEFTELTDFINFHVLVGLDPTSVVDTPAAVFLQRIAPGIGVQITNEMDVVLTDTAVQTPLGGFPFVETTQLPSTNSQERPYGARIDEYALRTMALYLQELRAPLAPEGDDDAIARGRAAYFAQCASCHNDPFLLSPVELIPIDVLELNHNPATLLARGFPYTDMLNDRVSTYDDRVVLFDRIFEESQIPSLPRELAATRLVGLHMRRQLLHNGSVPDLQTLLDPARGPAAPHPFYVTPAMADDLIEFLTRR